MADIKNELEENVIAITVFSVLSVVITLIFAVMVFGLPLSNKLPGTQDKISNRTKQEMAVLFAENPSVVGGWILRQQYEKTEVPIIHYWARDPIIHQFIRDYTRIQKEGKGHSSAELRMNPRNVLSGEREAIEGLIRCVSVRDSTITEYTPNIINFIQSLCIATLPPFAKDRNLGIVVVVDVPPDAPEIEAVKQMLLRLQIDIYNRDYQGHEIWSGHGLSSKN